VTVLALFLGVFAWTFAEYALHDWVGHLTRGRTDFSREHLEHHRREGYFAPTPKKARTAVLVLLPMGGLATWVFGLPGLAFAVGFAAAYVSYEVLHRRIHTHAPRNAYGRWARRHHLHHHHRDARTNHGVTSPLWDWVFGTLAPCPEVRVPRKRAPGWLVDEAGEVRPAYAAEYVLVGPAGVPPAGTPIR
jgi:sterol desaturase/sphingolipid hydroxylase (fatty acid hydroxylase superfamily)